MTSRQLTVRGLRETLKTAEKWRREAGVEELPPGEDYDLSDKEVLRMIDQGQMCLISPRLVRLLVQALTLGT